MTDILLSTYNGARFVREFLASLGQQTCHDFRLLVRDDGSEDATLDIVREAVADYGISQAVFLESSGQHLGVVQSYGELLRQCSGQDVMFADQDDIWHDNKVAEMQRLMREAETRYGNNTPLLLHSDLRVCSEDGSLMADSFLDWQRFNRHAESLTALTVQNNVTGCAMMINHAMLERCRLPFPLEAICHDWYLALVASALGQVIFTDQALVDYRVHSGNCIGARRYGPGNWLRLGHTELKRRLNLTQRQAGAFLRQYGDLLSATAQETVSAWSEIGDLPKFRRLARCLKFGFRKNTLARNLGLWWAI